MPAIFPWNARQGDRLPGGGVVGPWAPLHLEVVAKVALEGAGRDGRSAVAAALAAGEHRRCAGNIWARTWVLGGGGGIEDEPEQLTVGGDHGSAAAVARRRPPSRPQGGAAPAGAAERRLAFRVAALGGRGWPLLVGVGVTIGWSEGGSGRQLLLVHRGAVDSADWDLVRELRSLGSRTAAMDRRGRGQGGRREQPHNLHVEADRSASPQAIHALHATLRHARTRNLRGRGHGALARAPHLIAASTDEQLDTR